MNITEIVRPAGAALAGMATAVFEMTAPMLVLTWAFVVADTVTAVRLQRRLERQGKIGRGEARFSSRRFGRMFVTMARILGLLILTAMADTLVLEPLGLGAMKLVAGAVCFWQAVSLLENEAAANDAPWAEHARRYLVDKAKRYVKNGG